METNLDAAEKCAVVSRQTIISVIIIKCIVTSLFFLYCLTETWLCGYINEYEL